VAQFDIKITKVTRSGSAGAMGTPFLARFLREKWGFLLLLLQRWNRGAAQPVDIPMTTLSDPHATIPS
jgi:hypothetical protein